MLSKFAKCAYFCPQIFVSQISSQGIKNTCNFMLILNSLNWVQKMCRKKLKAKKQRKKVHNPKTQN